jgi:hypothetical protein
MAELLLDNIPHHLQILRSSNYLLNLGLPEHLYYDAKLAHNIYSFTMIWCTIGRKCLAARMPALLFGSDCDKKAI